MTTDPDRQDRIWQLFDAALELEADRRAAFLAGLDDDADVISEVRELLAGHDATGGVLDQPILPDRSAVPDPTELPDLEARVRAAFAGAYRLVRELGRGGMSRVYLAWEQKHERRVVLKVLRPEVAAAHGSERFVHEANLIARLSHPNIIPLIDSGVRDGLAFHVMPYIHGHTLREELESSSDRRLGPDRALTVLGDVATALAFAHAAGVVHRDLKPDNILLAGAHTYLFDFGIALAVGNAGGGVRGDAGSTPVTRTGAFLGTPGYAAPEQVWGGRAVDARADIWAWGVLATEVLTGSPPDAGTIDDDGASSEPLHPTLPAEVPAATAEIIANCLAPDPDARPADASLILEALGNGAPRPAGVAPAPSLSRARTVGVAAVLVLAMAAVIAVTQRGDFPSPGPGAAAGAATLTLPVAVAPFEAESGDSATEVLGRFASDWVSQGLQELEGIRVIPWPTVRMALGSEGDDDVVRRVATGTGAGTVVAGTIFDVDGRLRLSAEIVDAASGLVVSSPEAVSVPRDSAEVGIGLLVDRIRASAAIGVDPRLAAIPGLARNPPSFDAYRAFDRGIELATAQEYGPAADAFAEAWARDTTFHQALVFSAINRINRDEYAVADSLLDRVEPYLDRLATAERLRWELARGSTDGDAGRAYSAMSRLVELAPASRAPYNAALLAMSLNRPGEALEYLTDADPDRGELRGWAQYWTQLAHAHHQLGDFSAEARAAAEMRARYPERRVALVLEVRAHGASGDNEAVAELLELAETLPPETYWSAGGAAVVAAEALRAHGQGGWEDVLAWARTWLDARIAEEPGYRSHRYWRASADYTARDWAAAAERFGRLHVEVPTSDTYRGMLALSLGHLGRIGEAEDLLAEGFEREPGARRAYRARLAAVQGDADAAVGLLSTAFAEGVDGWVWMHASGFDDFEPVRADPRIARLLAPTG